MEKAKKYYEITTSMLFEKTVLVPVDEVEDECEAKEIVDNAVETCEINLLGDDAYCDTDIKRIVEYTDKDARYHQIIRKCK